MVHRNICGGGSGNTGDTAAAPTPRVRHGCAAHPSTARVFEWASTPDTPSSIDFALKSDPANRHSVSLNGCGGYVSDPKGAGQIGCSSGNTARDSLQHTVQTPSCISLLMAYTLKAKYAQVADWPLDHLNKTVAERSNLDWTASYTFEEMRAAAEEVKQRLISDADIKKVVPCAAEAIRRGKAAGWSENIRVAVHARLRRAADGLAERGVFGDSSAKKSAQAGGNFKKPSDTLRAQCGKTVPILTASFAGLALTMQRIDDSLQHFAQGE